MPLAFDFTSTFVMGVTLPVATTLLARSPFSTLASFDGSILVPPRVAAKTPTAISSTMPESHAAPDNQFATLLLMIPVTVHNASCICSRLTPPSGVKGAVPLPSHSCTRSGLLLFLRKHSCSGKLMISDVKFRCEA